MALLPLLLLAGCRGTRQGRPEPVSPPFVFRSLDLRQRTPLGQPSWELTSPEARYDLRRRVAQANRPKGLIFSGGKPLYRLQADSGTVVSDGEAILLEGNLRLQRLGPEPVLIRATRARWLPRRQLLLIDRGPEAYDRQGRIRAERARFLIQDDRLELSGQPVLERWEQRADPFTTAARPPASMTVNASRVSWKPGSGELRADGPLLGRRRPAGSAPGDPPQELRAASLVGNTLNQSYRLAGEVRFLDTARSQSFSGRDLQLQVGRGEASSDAPFEASLDQLRVSGTGVTVDSRAHWLRIAAGCRLDRPGERLEAHRCGWNWKSNQVEASGNVLIERNASAQISRGQVLSGSLGENGSVRITAPGSRVVSRFRPARSAPPSPPASRPAPTPIVP